MTESKAADIAEFDPLQVRPETLARIQFRGIGWQALDVEPLGRAIGQERLDDVTPVYRRSIPDQYQTAGHFPQHVLQEGHHVCRIDRAVLTVKIQLALWGHGTDGREMIARPPLPQDRRVAHRGVSPDDAGQGIEAGFVYEKNALLLGLRPLLMAGQVSSRQQAMAASSRWRARRTGFCGLQRSAWSKRPTWTGW